MNRIVVQSQENGPYLVIVEGKPLASLCRCGLSGTKPLCDRTHERVGRTGPSAPVMKSEPSVSLGATPPESAPVMKSEPSVPFGATSLERPDKTSAGMVETRKVCIGFRSEEPPLGQMVKYGQITESKGTPVNKAGNSFGDGIGPYKEHYCYKVHPPHVGIHCYVSIPLGPSVNEIRKLAWVGKQWMQESRFIRVKSPSGDLTDYSLKSFRRLLQGEKTHFRVFHHAIYKGPYYTPNWGTHNLTVTRELIPGSLGVGVIRRTAWAHESPRFGEFCYSWRDGLPGIRVIRYSLQNPSMLR